MISMWYSQDQSGCGKGTTWLNLHEVVGDHLVQKQGIKIADEPVTSPVIVGGRIYVLSSNGALNIGGDVSATIAPGVASPKAGVEDLYQLLSWKEMP
jgi:hypothetical protein